MRLFKKKVTVRDIIISNIGFNNLYNHFRQNYNHSIVDNFSEDRWYDIMHSLLKVLENDVDDDMLYETVLDGLELISVHGCPRAEFEIHAEKLAKAVNKFKGEKFKTARKNILESKFSVNNINESLRKQDEKERDK